MLVFLDFFFLITHTALTFFNAFGWAWPKARVAHSWALGFTAFSWIVLGYFYGWGFCFLTEWHWQVRAALGQPIAHSSYIQFLIAEWTGYVPPLALTEYVTLTVFLLAIILNVYFRLRAAGKRREDSHAISLL